MFCSVIALAINFVFPNLCRAEERDINLEGTINIRGHVKFDKKLNLRSKSLIQKVIIGLETDRVQIKILDSPQQFINSGQVKIDLSKLNLSDYSQIQPKSYAIHGIYFANQTRYNSNLIYEANSIDAIAIWTIEIIFPKGILKPSLTEQIFYWSANNSLIWFVISFFLILLTFLIFLYLIWKRHQLEKIKKSRTIINAPPSDLSPSALAILEEKQSSERAIAAGILYLAVRGYVMIVKNQDKFLVSKRKEPEGLSEVDRIFYNLLIGKWFAKSSDEISLENNRELFNESAGQLHRQIYEELINKKLFVGDPWLTVHLTKIIGIILLLTSVALFMISLNILPYPPFASIMLIAMMAVSGVIYKFSQKMPLRSRQGVAERQLWYQFKNYLTSPQAASLTDDLPMDFYLPYAIALKCEWNWIMRFSSTNYQIPIWYVGPSVTVEDIAQDMVDFVAQFSSTIDSGIAPEEQ